jgi:DNA-binding transcriptional ArsR family regulator
MDTLSAKFAALADPTRRAMLARLASGETTLSELAKPLAMTVPGAAKHLQVLERAGLVVRGPRSVVRPVRLQPDAFAEMTGWIDACRNHWEGSFDRLATHLATTANEPDAP